MPIRKKEIDPELARTLNEAFGSQQIPVAPPAPQMANNQAMEDASYQDKLDALTQRMQAEKAMREGKPAPAAPMNALDVLDRYKKTKQMLGQ